MFLNYTAKHLTTLNNKCIMFNMNEDINTWTIIQA